VLGKISDQKKAVRARREKKIKNKKSTLNQR
jgi:hypothetical protein